MFNPDLTARLVTQTLLRYYEPVGVQGIVTNPLNQPLAQVPVRVVGQQATTTTTTGEYALTLPAPVRTVPPVPSSTSAPSTVPSPTSASLVPSPIIQVEVGKLGHDTHQTQIVLPLKGQVIQRVVLRQQEGPWEKPARLWQKIALNVTRFWSWFKMLLPGRV